MMSTDSINKRTSTSYWCDLNSNIDIVCEMKWREENSLKCSEVDRFNSQCEFHTRIWYIWHNMLISHFIRYCVWNEEKLIWNDIPFNMWDCALWVHECTLGMLVHGTAFSWRLKALFRYVTALFRYVTAVNFQMDDSAF